MMFIQIHYLEIGRDKFNKGVQNVARLLMYFYVTKDPKSELAAKWRATFILFRDFRKLDRLFKGLADIEKARELAAVRLIVTFHLFQHFTTLLTLFCVW
jgi:hypothetical protein